MRVTIYAVGRMKAGPERMLCERYLDRFAKVGGKLGLDFAGVTEVTEGRASSAAARRAEESRKLNELVESGAALVMLDERGAGLDSAAFAAYLAGLRDDGRKAAVLAIGGPDGHEPSLRARAGLLVSLGAMTWPHQIARILLAEQLYRAATILSGHPYHRD
jgi:23S rRNA (pseudouridine1915-N3)-methyltransferase